MIIAILLMVVSIAAIDIVHAEDLETKSGVKYKDIDVIETTSRGFKFISGNKTHWVDFKDLPGSVAASYGYDPEKAAVLDRKLATEGDKQLIFSDELSISEINEARKNKAHSGLEVIRLSNGLPVIYDHGYFHRQLPWWGYYNGGFVLTPHWYNGSWRWQAGVKCWNDHYYPFADSDPVWTIFHPELTIGLTPQRQAEWTTFELCWLTPTVAEAYEKWENEIFSPRANAVKTNAKLLGENIDFEKKAILIEESKGNRNPRYREIKRQPGVRIEIKDAEKKP